MRTSGARWAVIGVVLGSGAALAVSTLSSTTRGDLVFGLVSWLAFVVQAAIGACVVIGLTFGFRRLRGRDPANVGRVALVALLVGVAAAFPVGAEWDEDGSRASGLVPATQALTAPIWPRSEWNSERRRAPILGYAYTCCG